MEATKRHVRCTFTPNSCKKSRFDSSVSYTRVYFSSNFDLFNFADTFMLRLITQQFPNCYLIVGIEEDSSHGIMSLQDREECLRLCPSVRQIMTPAPEVNFEFLKAYRIKYVCATPQQSKIYSHLGLGDGLYILNPPIKLTNNDLIARIISRKKEFVEKNATDQGENSIFKRIASRFARITGIDNWKVFKFQFFNEFRKNSTEICRRIVRDVEKIENTVREHWIGSREDQH